MAVAAEPGGDHHHVIPRSYGMFMTNHAPIERSRRDSIVAQLLIMFSNDDTAEAQSTGRCWLNDRDGGRAVATQTAGRWLCRQDLVEA